MRQAPAPLTDAEIDGADVEDLGEIPFIEDPLPPPPPAGPAAPAPPPADDEGPGHARKDWRKQQPKPRTPGRTLRITAGIRADINAKISMPLEISGHIWAARDPLCGGRFLDQREAIADAFTDIVCDSADLVAFFTGPGGAFMKYLNLGAALWPVAEMVAAHHVYHSVALEGPQEPSGAAEARYAA